MTRTQRRHAQVHTLVERGLTISAISRQLGLDRKTVRRFSRAATATDLLGPGSERSKGLDPFLAYLQQRWREGCRVATALHRELHERGCRGSRRTVQRYVAEWPRFAPPSAQPKVTGSRTLAWLLLRRRSELDDADRVLLQQLCRQDQEVAVARRLAQWFLVLVRRRRGAELSQWVAAVQATAGLNSAASPVTFGGTGQPSRRASPSHGVPDRSKAT